MIKKKYKIVKNVYFKRIFYREDIESDICNQCYFFKKDINCADIKINNKDLHHFCCKSTEYEDFTLGGLLKPRPRVLDKNLISYIPDENKLKLNNTCYSKNIK
jgi:hypothetical protein